MIIQRFTKKGKFCIYWSYIFLSFYDKLKNKIILCKYMEIILK